MLGEAIPEIATSLRDGSQAGHPLGKTMKRIT